MKIIGNIGHKLGLERQILIDGLHGCCIRQLMVGRLNVNAYHLFGIAIDTVDILLRVRRLFCAPCESCEPAAAFR